MIDIYFGDNLPVLRDMAAGAVNLIYIDPPFNTGKAQRRTSLSTIRDEEGDRVGFKGRRYKTVRLETRGYNDSFTNLPAFLRPRLEEARRVLADDGSMFFHIDYRESHYCKVMLDEIFGRDSFINEIIWAYDYGARSRTRWSTKHDTILWYAKNPESYVFDYESIDRIPYMAPGLVGPEKAARGKTPTDVWWHTIVSPNGREKTGYATQKPLGILRRIVKVHSRRGTCCVIFLPEAAVSAQRRWSWGATACWWTRTPKPCASWNGASPERTCAGTAGRPIFPQPGAGTAGGG